MYICNMQNVLSRYNPWWDGAEKPVSLINRESLTNMLLKQLSNQLVVFVTGLRRSGKTSVFKLFIYQLINETKIDPKKILYISLDDYLLRNNSIIEITEEFRKLNKIKFDEKIFLFFDEITSKTDYEIQLKNLHDLHNVKIFASSSSASLLKKGKPYLTGRSIALEVLPLDFNEYLLFKNIKLKSSDSHLLEGYFSDFISSGGIPGYVLTDDPSYLSNLVDDIIYKDIAAIYNIKSPAILKEYYLLLMERAGKLVSINKLSRILKISPDTSKRYLEYFSSVFLIYQVRRCGKTNETILAQKKIYAPDLGIRNHLTGFRDKGSLFENYVFLKLKHLSPCYYFRDGVEIDFAVKHDFLIEAKYHNEPLSTKQQNLFDSSNFTKKEIIRNSFHLDSFIEQANYYYGKPKQ